jgi:hypothetical protein
MFCNHPVILLVDFGQSNENSSQEMRKIQIKDYNLYQLPVMLFFATVYILAL